MSEPDFREGQHAKLQDPHIAPITNYVTSLRKPEWAPFVAPIHGGVNSRMLAILRDPGPATLVKSGSGMICVENNDQTAETQHGLMAASGLTPADYLPWNAYPWYINRAPTRVELEAGAAALLGLLELLPDLEVVLLQGNDAQACWNILLDRHPEVYRRELHVLRTYHPSVQALRSNVLAERERRRAHRATVWGIAGELLLKNPRRMP